MAKTDTGSFWSGLLETSLYKRNQGRLSRQLTAAGLGVVVLVGAYILSQGPLSALDNKAIKLGTPVAICAVAGWLIFRLVNYPLFAEFLISVEGEMNKVSWGTKEELYRATVVVLGTMLFLAAILYAYDGLWLIILRTIGVLQA
jgi:preprotein translocase subunit SecE